MPLPIQANATCDIYRNGNSPPLAPVVAAVPCVLLPAFRGGQRATANLVFTHLLLVAADVDLRDGYTGSNTFSGLLNDVVYVPSGVTTTPYYVRFVERVGRGTAQDHQRAYLDRQEPGWPTNDL